MQAARRRHALIFSVLVMLAGCASGGAPLLRVNSPDDGPDEFTVLPAKPLQAAPASAGLPEPVPGGPNLADPTPVGDAVAALGGNPGILTRAGVPAADAPLLRHATRYGVSPSIRTELAQADERIRRGGAFRIFGGLFGGIKYYNLYRGQWLNKSAELARLRAAGVAIPSAPPQ